METELFDLVVIGAGQGGLLAAHMAARLGAKVALIEIGEVGGT
jgi:glutathione reductase (NADPH)